PRLELRRRPPERRAAPARDPAAMRLRGGRGARGLGRVAAALRADDALAGLRRRPRHDRRGPHEARGLRGRAAVAHGALRRAADARTGLTREVLTGEFGVTRRRFLHAPIAQLD